MKLEKYELTIARPDDVTVARLKYYILDAVNNWNGQFGDDDPLFDPWRVGISEGLGRLPAIKIRRLK